MKRTSLAIAGLLLMVALVGCTKVEPPPAKYPELPESYGPVRVAKKPAVPPPAPAAQPGAAGEGKAPEVVSGAPAPPAAQPTTQPQAPGATPAPSPAGAEVTKAPEAATPGEKPTTAAPTPAAPAEEKKAAEAVPPAPQAYPVPDQKAIVPSAPAVSDAMRELAMDIRVCRVNITQAQQLVKNQEWSRAVNQAQGALRSAAFVNANLPSSRVKELTQRAAVHLYDGNKDGAKAAIAQIEGLLSFLTTPTPATDLRAQVRSTLEAIDKGNFEQAKTLLSGINEGVGASEAEDLMRSVMDYLQGATASIFRRAGAVPEAELDEALKALNSLEKLVVPAS